MASSEHRIGSEGRGTTSDHTEAIIKVVQIETALKKDKARVESNFTRAQNKLSSLIEEQELPSRWAIQDVINSLGNYQEVAMEIMASLSHLYMKHKDFEKSRKVLIEIDKIEDDFSSVSEAAREYLDSRRNDRSSVSSDIISIDLGVRQGSGSYMSETYKKNKRLAG